MQRPQRNDHAAMDRLFSSPALRRFRLILQILIRGQARINFATVNVNYWYDHHGNHKQ